MQGDEDDLHDQQRGQRQRQARELPQLQGHQRDHDEEGERDGADVVDDRLRDPEPPGELVEVAQHDGGQHGADVAGEDDALGGEPVADAGANPHREQQQGRRLHQRVRLAILAARRSGPSRQRRLHDLLGDDRRGIGRGGRRRRDARAVRSARCPPDRR